MESIFSENFTLRQLSHFIAVAERGTVSGAAIDLNMSQSAVSASLSQLERTLGARLCVRRKAHGVALTPTGQAVFERARALLAEASELGYLVKGGDQITGPLKVGCLTTLSPTALPPLLSGFSAANPAVSLGFVEGDQEVLLEQLQSGGLDVAILWEHQLPGDVHKLPLYAMRLYVLLAADHPLADREKVSLKELEPSPMILLDPRPLAYGSLSELRRFGMEPDVHYRPQTFELARGLVARGLGWSVFYQRARVATSYEGLPVVSREIEEDVNSINVAIVWSRSAPLTSRAEAFVRFARQSGMVGP